MKPTGEKPVFERKTMQTSNSPSGVQNPALWIRLSKFAALLAALVAFVFPGKIAAQVDCDLCVHGGALLENFSGTNCLGQLISGKSHAGDTVFVRLVARNVDCCPV